MLKALLLLSLLTVAAQAQPALDKARKNLARLQSYQAELSARFTGVDGLQEAGESKPEATSEILLDWLGPDRFAIDVTVQTGSTRLPASVVIYDGKWQWAHTGPPDAPENAKIHQALLATAQHPLRTSFGVGATGLLDGEDLRGSLLTWLQQKAWTETARVDDIFDKRCRAYECTTGKEKVRLWVSDQGDVRGWDTWTAGNKQTLLTQVQVSTWVPNAKLGAEYFKFSLGAFRAKPAPVQDLTPAVQQARKAGSSLRRGYFPTPSS